MTNRTRAEKLFKAERDLKAARKKVERLVDLVALLTKNLERSADNRVAVSTATTMPGFKHKPAA